MTETKTKEKKTQSRERKDEALMTHLMSYQGPRDQEIRLHDAEFRGGHYFDFRFYEKRSRGTVPTRRGIRLSAQSVKCLEDAISRWRTYVKGLGHSDSGEKSVTTS